MTTTIASRRPGTPTAARPSTAGAPVTAETRVPTGVSGVAGGSVTATMTLPPPAVPPSTGTLSGWAAQIDADGIEVHENLARRLAAAASGAGLCPVLVDVLADPTEPPVARERAFGRLSLALAQTAA